MKTLFVALVAALALPCLNTQSLFAQCAAPTCTGHTQTMGGWGSTPSGNNPGTYLQNNFAAAFPAPNYLTVGCTRTIKLTSAAAVRAFLPQSGTPKALTTSLVNPTTSIKNTLAGQVVALYISLTFDAVDPNFGSGNLGTQVIKTGTFKGWTVQQVYDEAAKRLGGCASAYTASQLSDAVAKINENYVDGNLSGNFLSCGINVCCTASQVCPGANGTVTITYAGGVAPFTFAWSNGATTQNITAPAGTYTVTVTGAGGQTATATCEITEFTSFEVGFANAQPTCPTQCTGAVCAQVSPAGTYSYSWSTGSTADCVQDLCAGPVSVTVTDINGCPVSGQTSVPTVDPFVGFNAVVTQPTCEANNGSIVYNANAAFTYEWDNEATGSSLTGLAAGDYCVTITSQAGCTTTACFTLVDPVCECAPLRTQTQGGWGNMGGPGQYLYANFDAAFENGLTIGCEEGFTLSLTSKEAITDFLPSGSTPSALDQNYVDPGQDYQNVFAAQLVAATLNVTFDAYDADFGAGSQSLGGMYYKSGTFAGFTVNEVIAIANDVIGGCSDAYSFSALSDALAVLNENFVDGTKNKKNLTCEPVGVRLAENTLVIDTDVYPNPTTGAFALQIVASTGVYNVKVVDMMGRVVMNQTHSLVDGYNSLNVDLTGATAATYNVIVSNGANAVSKRVVVSK